MRWLFSVFARPMPPVTGAWSWKRRTQKIVEFKDASDEEKAINLCNSGCMCFDGKTMFELLEAIGNENAAGEYYLTDAVAVARQKGLKCTVVECSPEEVAGANTREELALLESFLNKRKGK